MNRPVILTIGREAERFAPYLDSVVRAGAECRMFAPEQSCHLDDYAGLLLMGGTDVDSLLYGQKPGPENDEPDQPRDHRESELLAQAFHLDLPVLAICRGMQILNVVAGGTLIQHLAGHRVRGQNWVHDVEVSGGSLLAEALGMHGLVGTNSRHHQAVDIVGDGLEVSARAPDGVIEAVERSASTWVVGVQWHPEDLTGTQPEQFNLFRRFVDACRS